MIDNLKYLAYLSCVTASWHAMSFTYSPEIDLNQPIDTWPLIHITSLPSLTPIWTNGTDRDIVYIQSLIASNRQLPGSPSHPRMELGFANPEIPCKRDINRGGIYCGEVFLSKIGEIPDEDRVRNVLRDIVLRTPFKHRLYSTSIGSVAGTCSMTISIRVYGVVSRAYREDTPCQTTAPPESVSCTVDGPSTLIHQQQYGDQLDGTVGADWMVSCTGTTKVKVSTSSEVKLYSNTGNITSGLYVDRPGMTSTDLDVDRTTKVFIVSKLENRIAAPGVYTGSGVITISWY